MNFQQTVTLFLISILVITLSCRRDDAFKKSGIQLRFSTDTLTFDTVFTQLGSVTKRFKVINTHDEPVEIQSIQIKNEANLGETQFRMNVDGFSGNIVRNLEIAANDSAFVFIEVTVNPVNQNNPLVLYDAVEFVTQNNVQDVVLEAWGQDAYYYNANPDNTIQGLPAFSRIIEYDEYFPITTNITLPNDKPHVIFNYLMVDSAVTLNIPEGTQIHLFKGAGLWVAPGGALNVNGKKDNEVVFQGIRLEDFYDDIPGQWDRIWINESNTNSSFNHAIIKNGFIGIQAEVFPFSSSAATVSPNQLSISNTQIQNMDGLALLARNYNVNVENSLFYNSQNQLMAVQGGGDINVLHSTLANYWGFGGRSSGSFFATNGYTDAFGVDQFLDLNVNIDNSIIYGTNREELEIDSLEGSVFSYSLENTVVKTELDTNARYFMNCIFNPEAPFGVADPLFIAPGNADFELYAKSAAISVGSLTLTDTLTTDLKGDQRDTAPDAGCYEFVP